MKEVGRVSIPCEILDNMTDKDGKDHVIKLLIVRANAIGLQGQQINAYRGYLDHGSQTLAYVFYGADNEAT